MRCEEPSVLVPMARVAHGISLTELVRPAVSGKRARAKTSGTVRTGNGHRRRDVKGGELAAEVIRTWVIRKWITEGM